MCCSLHALYLLHFNSIFVLIFSSDKHRLATISKLDPSVDDKILTRDAMINNALY